MYVARVQMQINWLLQATSTEEVNWGPNLSHALQSMIMSPMRLRRKPRIAAEMMISRFCSNMHHAYTCEIILANDNSSVLLEGHLAVRPGATELGLTVY